MQQTCCRFFGHAGIAICGTGCNALEQNMHGAHFRFMVKCGHKMHFRCARICETNLNIGPDKCSYQTLCTVHGFSFGSGNYSADGPRCAGTAQADLLLTCLQHGPLLAQLWPPCQPHRAAVTQWARPLNAEIACIIIVKRFSRGVVPLVRQPFFDKGLVFKRRLVGKALAAGVNTISNNL